MPTATSYDLSSPREWLEYREHISGGTYGAYTVIRCDYYPSRSKHQQRRQNEPSTSNPWHIWGRQYHLDRLRHSYWILIEQPEGSPRQQVVPEPDQSYQWKQILDDASSKTEILISSLLGNTESQLNRRVKNNVSDGGSSEDDHEEDNSFITVMLTLLWEPFQYVDSASDSNVASIAIHGHVFTSETDTKYNDYNPINGGGVASLAIPTTASAADEFRPLPNRYENSPTAKLSSWCRQRRPLEKQYKEAKHGIVDEVVLVQQLHDDDNKKAGASSDDDGHLCLLEGLTSNLFVVYPGGIIRTPSSGVLNGYARHLVVNQVAKKFGMSVDTDNPILLQDSHLWEEVFVTSSIRLIIPIRKIIHFPRTRPTKSNPLAKASQESRGQGDDGDNFEDEEIVWSMTKRNGNETIWRKIYSQMRAAATYDTDDE